MSYTKPLTSRVHYFIGALIVFSFIQGCTIKLVADYDAKVAQEIINVSKEVDKFYGELIETSDSDRTYNRFKDKYIKIEVDIRALIVQNKSRPLNDESISIAETTLDKWLKYKKSHKEKNTYKVDLAKNHRKRFTRLFTAMSVAEEAKKMNSQKSKKDGGEK